MMYDLIILGGGPAGYNAAERAGAAGLKTLVIEERALGGVCLNEGCIPTKTLLYSAKIYDYAKHGADYGVTFGSAAIDHGFVVNRKNKVVKQLVSGVGAKMKKAGVEVVNATAFIKGRDAEGFTVVAADKEYVGKQLLIATGSSPALPPIDGLADSLKSGFALTNREVLDLQNIPKTIVVVGGGVIGLEMASYFNSVGSKVYVLEMLDHIAGATDREISELLKKEYAKRGVEFILGAKVTSIKNNTVSYEKDSKVNVIEADYALVSIGRRPRTQGIGCENIGLKLERGAIVTNEYGKTNVPGVWAAGDVNGKSMLAHTAYREGEVCINNILGKKDRINYNSIPAVIYTNPEVASVGETSESVKEKGIDSRVETLTLKYSGRYIAENEHGNGILKVIVNNEHNNVIGLHMIGSYASEIIYGAAMMVETEMRVTDIQKLVFPHPTVCEVIREAMFE
ncbi:MAG: dihydrolipoyl dehydrogenase [Ruminococcaceae bacterium]|nr:dihydrolipoyl dehydrogenase [Oscillospiraceae bacterium]